jgi:hypothetical protein
MRPAARVGLWLAVSGVLVLIAIAYLNPHLMVDLAAQLWACF